MSAETAEAAVDAAETSLETETPEIDQEQEHDQEQQRDVASSLPESGHSLEGELIAGMEDVPAEVREEIGKAENAQRPTPNAERSKAEPEKKAGEATASDKDEDRPVDNTWPDSAKQRVAQEAEKRRRRTAELNTERAAREKLQKENEELKKRSPVQVAPTSDNPLAHLNDPSQVAQRAAIAKALVRFARRNPDGVENVPMGQDKEGNEIVRSYSKEEIQEMLDENEDVLEAAPARMAFLRDQRIIENAARTDYPVIFEEGTKENEEYKLILQQLPEITRFPDYQYWIADAIYRRNERATLAKGKGERAKSETVRALTERQPAKARTATTARAATPEVRGERSEVRGADKTVDKLEKAVIESGGDENAIDNLIGGILDGSRSRRMGREEALV